MKARAGKGKCALARYPFDVRLALCREAADRPRSVCSPERREQSPAARKSPGFDWRRACCNREGRPGHHPGFAPENSGDA